MAYEFTNLHQIVKECLFLAQVPHLPYTVKHNVGYTLTLPS